MSNNLNQGRDPVVVPESEQPVVIAKPSNELKGLDLKNLIF
jgi:hypothetical protein